VVEPAALSDMLVDLQDVSEVAAAVPGINSHVSASTSLLGCDDEDVVGHHASVIARSREPDCMRQVGVYDVRPDGAPCRVELASSLARQ
jgi:hypothetical protein